MLRGIAMDIALLQFPITSITPSFQDILLESDYFGDKSDERVYIDLRDSLEYTNEIEKPSGND